MIRTFVLVPVLVKASKSDISPIDIRRSDLARLEEAKNLALAIELEIIEAQLLKLSQLRAATLLGKGQVEEIAAKIADSNIELLIIDMALSPIQQRNLEKACNCKVIDRTGLILEIFGQRAKTNEGRLQVALAQLNYQKGRLVRTWTHLERQRGSRGFLSGPGETQLEADRRQINQKSQKIKRQLSVVTKTRALHRKKRQKVPYKIVALVGYTNAGKSSLFNLLTNSQVLAKDMLFATLDPTLRQVRLPSGELIILSDTVGFISDLPTHLVAAFRATLEEVIEADFIIHVRDISNPDHEAQALEVETIMRDMEVKAQLNGDIIEVWNKIDLLSLEQQEKLQKQLINNPQRASVFPVSCTDKRGIADLINSLDKHLFAAKQVYEIRLVGEQAHLLSWLYKYGHNVMQEVDEETGELTINLELTARQYQEFLPLYKV